MAHTYTDLKATNQELLISSEQVVILIKKAGENGDCSNICQG